MRDIKFRGKRKDDKEWVYGDLVTMRKNRGFIHPKANKFKHEASLSKGNMVLHEVIPETVGQYTELKDKNGKEIYEGDIVKQEYSAGPYGRNGEEYWEGYHLGVVRITATEGACMRNPYRFDEIEDTVYKINQYKNVVGYRTEIIGNIHENPELLEVDND
jgi:uncharacterized phage protein (TIGR01671 family)